MESGRQDKALKALARDRYYVDTEIGEIYFRDIPSNPWKVLQGSINTQNNYRYCDLYTGNSGDYVKLALHEIIWLVANKSIPEGYEIDHDNYNRLDCRLDNLNCLTEAEHHEKSRGKKKNYGKALRHKEIHQIKALWEQNKKVTEIMAITGFRKGGVSNAIGKFKNKEQFRFATINY